MRCSTRVFEQCGHCNARKRRFLEQKVSEEMSNHSATDWPLQIQVFPDGTRDFQFVFTETEEATGRALPFLFTERASWLLEQIERVEPRTAKQVFLAQLLTCCLEYRGNRRHLVVEQWTENEINGTSMRRGSQVDLGRNLSREQADEFQLITSGQLPPSGTLAEVFWEAHVTTPRLPSVFDDTLMGEMARSLLNVLNPNSEFRNELPIRRIRSALWSMWSDEFSDLELSFSPRKRRAVFKRLMSATIRFASQFNGQIARVYVLDSIRHGEFGSEEISDREHKLIELRYGGCQALEDVNVALLFDCDGLYRELVNDYGQVLAFGNDTDISECEQTLNGYFSLLRSFRERRKLARNSERRERRQRHQDFLPAPRVQAQGQPDSRAEDPTERNDEFPNEFLDWLMDHLKERDARRLQALVDADWDHAKAAETLGITYEQMGRQWRQTIKKNILLLSKEYEFGENQTNN